MVGLLGICAARFSLEAGLDSPILPVKLSVAAAGCGLLLPVIPLPTGVGCSPAESAMVALVGTFAGDADDSGFAGVALGATVPGLESFHGCNLTAI